MISQKLAITIVHHIPGRVRLRLSHAPVNLERIEKAVKQHAGIHSVTYTSITRSVLIIFDTAEVKKEEIIIRVALSLSLDYGVVPVRILAEPERKEISDSAFYTGLLLGAALVDRLVRRNQEKSILQWIAGLGTTAAVVEHGLSEVNQRGNFDPEVLSVVYLLTAMTRGDFLPAAIFTWMTTFGRHLVHVPAGGVEVRPVEFADKESGKPNYELVVSPDQPQPNWKTISTLLPNIIAGTVTGRSEFGQNTMLESIRNVSKLHNEVLEGLGDMRSGMPLWIR